MRAKTATSEEGTRKEESLCGTPYQDPMVVSRETPLILPKPAIFGIVLFFHFAGARESLFAAI